MRHPIPVLALIACLGGIPACTAEPGSTSPAPSVTVTVTADDPTAEQTMTSTNAHEARQSSIPLLDREAPAKVETATFALG